MSNLLLQESPMLLIIITLISLLLTYFCKSYIPLTFGILIILVLFYFYRVPLRKCNLSPNSIIAPSDGTIMKIISDPLTKRKTISIFLSPLDVHVQYIPYNGRIKSQIYKKGTFHPAYMFAKSQYNERNTIVIETLKGDISITQIAGMVARRIVSHVKVNNVVKKGDIYGMIKLSSRVDITLPSNVNVLVAEKQRIVGCETVLATFT